MRYDYELEAISSEDNKALKGFLMEIVQNDVSKHKSIRNMLLIASLVAALVGINSWKECVADISTGHLVQIASWMILYAIIIIFVCVGLYNFYYEIKHKPALQYMDAVRNNDYEAKTVRLIMADNSSGENWSTDYYAEIMSEEGELYKDRFPFFFKDRFEVGDAIYVKIKGTKNAKEVVIPGKKESPMTWAYGMKMYKKFTK